MGRLAGKVVAILAHLGANIALLSVEVVQIVTTGFTGAEVVDNPGASADSHWLNLPCRSSRC